MTKAKTGQYAYCGTVHYVCSVRHLPLCGSLSVMSWSVDAVPRKPTCKKCLRFASEGEKANG
jgi:hypothetical protein